MWRGAVRRIEREESVIDIAAWIDLGGPQVIDDATIRRLGQGTPIARADHRAPEKPPFQKYHVFDVESGEQDEVVGGQGTFGDGHPYGQSEDRTDQQHIGDRAHRGQHGQRHEHDNEELLHGVMIGERRSAAPRNFS